MSHPFARHPIIGEKEFIASCPLCGTIDKVILNIPRGTKEKARVNMTLPENLIPDCVGGLFGDEHKEVSMVISPDTVVCLWDDDSSDEVEEGSGEEDLLEPAPTQEPPPTQPTWSPPSHSSQQAAQAAHRSNCGASDQSDDGSEGDVGLRVFSPNTSRKAGAALALMRERLDLPPLPTRPTRTPPNSPRNPPQKRHHGQDD